jgi:hypothetical protein
MIDDPLLEQLIALGWQAQITLSRPLHPKSKGGQQPAQPQATAVTRMWALNRLQAAPGQCNRDLMRAFLLQRNWIAPAEEPESWQLEHVPCSKDSLTQLASELGQFEYDAKGQS